MAEKRVLGIDFTGTEIRLVEVVQKGKQTVLEHFAVGEIPPGVFAAGKVVEVDRLRTTIKDLMNTHRFKAKKAVLGVSGKYGVTRLITLPKMNASQTRDAIELQLSQYVPFSPGDTSYAYQVLREVKEEDQLQQEILLAATRRSTLAGLLTAMRKAGLQVVGVKITTLTSYNLFEDQYFDTDQAVGFCDVRDNVTDISFVAENLFRLSRSVEFGSGSIVEAVRRKLGGSNEETMEYLRYNPVDLTAVYAVTAEEAADIGGLAGVKGEEPRDKIVRDAVIRVLSTFVNELMRSIRYFESQQKRRSRVGKIVIFGNVGFLKNLQAYIAEQTGLDVLVVTELPHMQNALGELDQRLYHDHAAEGVVPASLAHDAATAKRIEYNLMPRETLVRRKTYSALKYVAGLYIVLLLVALAMYADKYRQAEAIKERIAVTDDDLRVVAPYFQETEDLKAEINKVAPKLEGVMAITKKQFPWEVLNQELARMMIDESWLTEFNIDAQSKTLEFTSQTFKVSNYMHFWVNLHNSRVYSVAEEEVDLETPDIDGGGGGGGGGSSEDTPTLGGSGASMPAPGGFGIGLNTQPVSFGRPQAHTMANPKPEPMYGLPTGPTGVGGIEGFWQGKQKAPLVVIEAGYTLTIRDDFITATQDIYEGLDSLKVN